MEEVCAKPEMITHSFCKSGISVAVDGSKDEIININGIDDTSNDACKESDTERSALRSSESDSTSDDQFEDGLSNAVKIVMHNKNC